MTPTPKLRYVQRGAWMQVNNDNSVTEVRANITLQQWWKKNIASRYAAAILGEPGGEWRDVPIEKEQA
jgi:hypothetical protein